MAFSWEKQLIKAEVEKKRRDKRKALHNPSFIAKLGITKVKELRR